jgi:hypothetical protein
MKTIVAGSRDITEFHIVKKAIKDSGFEITELVSGGARGVDGLGEKYARESHIPIKQFIPDWDKFGKSAGHKRNSQMADYADALIAIWDGVSKGTAGMIADATRKGLKVYVKDISKCTF